MALRTCSMESPCAGSGTGFCSRRSLSSARRVARSSAPQEVEMAAIAARKRSLRGSLGGFRSALTFHRPANALACCSSAEQASASASAMAASTASRSVAASASSASKSSPTRFGAALGAGRRGGSRPRIASRSRATTPKRASSVSVSASAAKWPRQSRSMISRRVS